MKNKIKVAVLMGGKSSEYEISVLSGKEVLKNLDKVKYSPIPVLISKEGKGIDKIFKTKCDVIFIAMHGPFGEDGTVQGMLELKGTPYTGSGVAASAIGMDKDLFRKVMLANDLPGPKYVAVTKKSKLSEVEKAIGKPPYFVKPLDQGSSVGASIVKKRSDLKKALKLAFRYSKVALIDEYIKGTEVTCAVIGNENPKALPVIEIEPLKGEFFDYKSKYTESGANEIVPARISKSLTKKVQDLSVEVYKAIKCRGFGRVDFILKNNKTPMILEINTIPGLTPMSLLPKAAGAAGISYSKLLTEIIDLARE